MPRGSAYRTLGGLWYRSLDLPARLPVRRWSSSTVSHIHLFYSQAST